MGVLDRINKINKADARNVRIGENMRPIDKPAYIANQPPGDNISSATQQEFSKTNTMDKINPDKVELKGVDWRTMDYDKASKVNPNMSRSQYISEVAKYRQEKNLDPMSYDEVFQALGGKNPYMTPEEEKKREKRMKAATYVDAIGGVLANLVNYVRTTNGNPAMNLSSLGRNEQRINAIRDYYSNLDKSKYSSYLDMFNKQWAEQEARNAEERKFKYQLALEENKRKSPLYQRQLETEEEKRKTDAARRENLLSSTTYNTAKAAGHRLTNERSPAKLEAELKNINARTAAANRSNRGSSSSVSSGSKSGKGKKEPYKSILKIGNSYSREYDLNNDDDVLEMYWQGVKYGLPEYFGKDEEGKNIILDLKDIDKIRNVLKYNRQYYITPEDKDYYKYVKINDYPKLLSPEPSNDDNNNNNDLDYQMYE